MTDSAVTAFVGDSLTERGDWQQVLPGRPVLNFGVGGNTTDDLLDRLDEVVDAGPTTVVLEIGTNDFAWRVPVEEVVVNIERVLSELRAKLPAARIIAQSILPRQQEYAHIVRGVNEQIAAFAPSVEVEYLDVWPALAGDDEGIKPEFTIDGLHLSASGYDAWYELLRAALVA
ncbi:MAG: GDSL-type esterase/lipase family protein [Microbacteriaceae bacterium]|nr:GDSL-type esterase/lipase family protein [Microbacteriaceae bacterium]MCL2795443.1 GDSL-type esterase/lipase family protein [Microbacteriaceae bacterium]